MTETEALVRADKLVKLVDAGATLTEDETALVRLAETVREIRLRPTRRLWP